MTRAPQQQDVWQFPATATGPGTEVVDGDTLRLRADLGFYVDYRAEVRLRAVDTAEIHGVSHDSDEYRTGQAHADFVESWLEAAAKRHDGDWELVITTEPADTGKYGRWIADVRRVHDSADLRADLVDAFGPDVLPDD